ncbi:MAG: hypothetical protein GY747_05585 [Planctomycetes bacterium]|nr:hypothetical protein [Planctomycetota bacterium]MCP4770407.1 hypothetical protein [Planctomycetota bacterium]MCP4860501.1 hypothetical protein [Planctomycetota bacterium]
MLSVATYLLALTSSSPAAIFIEADSLIAQDLAPVVVVEQHAAAISHEELLKRTYVHTVGARYVVQLKLDAAVDHEIQRRKKAGLWVGEVEVTDEEVQSAVQRQMEMVLAQDPTVDFWALMAAQGFTERTLAMELRRNLIAQRMFFPLDPEQWPVKQIKQIMPLRWQEFLKSDHASLLELKAKGELRLLNDESMKQFLMPDIWKSLLGQCTVMEPSAGLPSGLCLKVNDTEFATDDIYAIIEPLITDVDHQWVKTFVNNIELLEADLKASGHYQSQEDFEAYFAEEAGRYNDFFPHEMLVLQYFGFPSMETYRQYLRVRRSFRNTLPAEGTPQYKAQIAQTLLDHARSYGGGRAKADVILLSARDPESGNFPANGDPYQDAEARAKEVAQLLDAGEPFGQILLEYSDYQPSLETSSNTATQANRGRFAAINHSELRGLLMEDEYTDFLFGYSICDDIFYRATAKDVFGPIRGPLGYYFYRVDSYKAPRMAVDMEADPSMNWLVTENFLTVHLLRHLNDLRESAR